MLATIVLLEDDQDFRTFVEDLLTKNGYKVYPTNKGSDAIQMVEQVQPDLVILDLNLPDMSGEGVCMELRKQNAALPIIMLTAKNTISEKIQGLNVGADDYVTKPFIPEEFLARIKARLRQTAPTTTKLSVADLEMDTQKVEVKRANKVINLTPHEFKLLEYLLQNVGVVVSREMILNRVWAYSFDVESRVVDVYMGYLRKKIDTGFKQKLIHSVRGFGYSLHE